MFSAFLESHRDEYYKRLLAVSRDNDWTGWCQFFLGALRAQADLNHSKAARILALYEELKPRTLALTRSQCAVEAMDWLFERPIFKSSAFEKDAGIPEATAKRILALLTREGIITTFEKGRGRTAATLALPRLLNIAEGRQAF